MPKGTLNNPSTEKDGIWFPQIGEIKRLPRTSTQTMFHQAKISPGRHDLRLPLICQTQKGVQNGFPFSSHDNKHVLQGVGEYFDLGLGRKKTLKEKRRNNSQNFNVWCHGTPPRATSYGDGFTNHQVSYGGRQDTERPLLKRYPKHHHERSARSIRPDPENDFMWFADVDTLNRRF
ncbi:hypothetical protein FKM82_014581 [Ascaphus truei]|uniref:testis-expressed protein 36 isoform X2 n=1 Tax=Ascaphus truei TaxID=8439 RepID=UPI003F5AD8E7